MVVGSFLLRGKLLYAYGYRHNYMRMVKSDCNVRGYINVLWLYEPSMCGICKHCTAEYLFKSSALNFM